MRHWLRDATPESIDQARQAATTGFHTHRTPDGVHLTVRYR